MIGCLLVVVAFAEELIVLDEARVSKRFKTDATVKAALVPRVVHHSQKKTIFNWILTSATDLFLRNSHRNPLSPIHTRTITRKLLNLLSSEIYLNAMIIIA